MKEGEDRDINYYKTEEYLNSKVEHTITFTCTQMEKKDMKVKEPRNKNYCANVVKISNIVELENCDNVVAAIVSGYQVIVGKDAKIGDIGVFFPVECKLSKEFLSNNNLFRKAELNADKTTKNYIEDNQRLKCVKFRGNKSEGLLMPLESLKWTGIDLEDLAVGMEFDELNDKEICCKNIVRRTNTQNTSNKKKAKVDRVSRMVENQFRLHVDTEQFKKNMWKIQPFSMVSISRKKHGTSAVIGNVLVKRKLTVGEKILKFLGIKIQETEYGDVCASRNVIKNEYFNPLAGTGFYTDNIWQIWAEKLKGTLDKGITFYGEILGYLPTGGEIQKGYDYGCEEGTSKFEIYRITHTDEDGKVLEFTTHMIEEYCKQYGLESVEYFFYGYAKDIYPEIEEDKWTDESESRWLNNLLEKLEADERMGMNNITCPLNSQKVTSEGIVIRQESMFNPNPMKLKNFAFYEHETKLIDAGVEDIENADAEGETDEVSAEN